MYLEEYTDFKKATIKDEVQIIQGLIDFKIEQNTVSDEIKRNLDQQEILDWINTIRLRKDQYIIVLTMEGIILSHFETDNIGKNMWDFQDANGVKAIQEAINISQAQEGGYINYIGSIRPETGNPGRKITYAKSIPEWGWVIATGVYLDDIELVTKRKQSELVNNLKRDFAYIAIVLSIALILSIIVVKFFSTRMKENFASLTGFFRTAAKKSIQIDPGRYSFREFQDLAHPVNQMITSITKAQDELQHHQLQLEEKVRQRTEDLKLEVEKQKQIQKELTDSEKKSDINRRLLKKTNTELEKAVVLAKQANQAKTDFLANVSHEIRTPLSIIIGMGAVLADTQLDSPQKQYLSSMQNSGNQLLEILNNVLDFSRIESGDISVNNSQFSIESLTAELHSIIQPLAKEKGLDFTISYDNDLTINRIGDVVKIKQILINLLSNALKFTHKGRVVLRLEDNKTTKGESLFIFHVVDTGIGISKEKCPTVFDRFSQINSTSSRQNGGVGLGLSICKKLAGLVGGDIEVVSEIGKGTTFSLCLPLPSADIVDNNVSCRNEIMFIEGSSSPLQVLVVEDIFENFFVVQQFLSQYPAQLTHAQSGIEALISLDNSSFDLILMDIRMPIMDGIATVQEIRKRKRSILKNTPIIAMTAHAFEEQKKNYLADGFTDVLVKPFSKNQLIDVMQKYGNKKVNLSEKPKHFSYKEDSLVDRQFEVPEELRPVIGNVIEKIRAYIIGISQKIYETDQTAIFEELHSAKGLSGLYRLKYLSKLLENLSNNIKKRNIKNAIDVIGFSLIHLKELEEKYKAYITN